MAHALQVIDLGMARSSQQEQVGDAFLMAIAGAAGCAISPRRPDDDSIDWTLSCRLPRRPKIDVQMKTWIGDDGRGDELRYPLKRKNYDDLILTNVLVPRILVVVALPSEIDEWLAVSPEQLVIKRCGYWVSLAARDPTENLETVTVAIPRRNALTVPALQSMFQRLSIGDAL